MVNISSDGYLDFDLRKHLRFVLSSDLSEDAKLLYAWILSAPHDAAFWCGGMKLSVTKERALQSKDNLFFCHAVAMRELADKGFLSVEPAGDEHCDLQLFRYSVITRLDDPELFYGPVRSAAG